MEKVIIHSHISNISYAFTVGELAYRQFCIDKYRDNISHKQYDFPDGIVVDAIQNEKSIKVIVDYANTAFSELTEVEDDEQ